MEASRYAQLEDEQRYVVAALPPGATDPREIEDRYLRGTRLRLRRVTDPSGTIRKLGHKVRVAPTRPSAVWHTTCYLEADEFSVLSALDGDTLAKRRWTAGEGVADEFLGALHGLVLVEGPRGFRAPDGGVEVTDEEAFTGGALAALDASGAGAVVAAALRRVQ